MKHKLNILFLVTGLLLVFVMLRNSVFFIPAFVLVIVIFLVFLTWGVMTPQINYFLTAIHRIVKPYVLLTFDDGPDPEITPRILKILNDNRIKAVFFVIGSKAEKYPEIIREITHSGHLVGNHTYSHSPLFPLSSAVQVRKEIERTNDIIRNITGKDVELFRPPVGYTNPIIARVSSSMHLTVVGWKKRTYDTVLKNTDILYRRLLSLTKPGSIILLHDNLHHTEAVLSKYISEAQKNGIIFVNESTIHTILE